MARICVDLLGAEVRFRDAEWRRTRRTESCEGAPLIAGEGAGGCPR